MSAPAPDIVDFGTRFADDRQAEVGRADCVATSVW